MEKKMQLLEIRNAQRKRGANARRGQLVSPISPEPPASHTMVATVVFWKSISYIKGLYETFQLHEQNMDIHSPQ